VSYSFQELTQIARQAGWGDEAELAAAIAIGESSGNPNAHNSEYPDDSYGLMQINMLDLPDYQLGASRRARYGLRSNEELKDPLVNMRIAKDIRDTSGLKAWSVYTSGTANEILKQQTGKSDFQTVSAPPPVPVGQDQQRNFIQRGLGGVLRFFGIDPDPEIPGKTELEKADTKRTEVQNKSEQELVRQQMNSILGSLVNAYTSDSQIDSRNLDALLAADEQAAALEEQAREGEKLAAAYNNKLLKQQQQINALKNALSRSVTNRSSTSSNSLSTMAKAFANQARPIA